MHGVRVERVRDIPAIETRRDVTRAHRIAFHLLLLPHRGAVRHMVDFADHTLGPDDVLWVRPGQVHRFVTDPARCDATTVIIEPGFLDPRTASAAGLDVWDSLAVLHPTTIERPLVNLALAHLQAEYEAALTTPPDRAVTLVRHCLAAFVLRIGSASIASRPPSPVSPLFAQFRKAVERDFTRTRSVSAYAHTLGYSRRTVASTVKTATGQTAKEFIDARVILEAKRLLAHTDLPAWRIGTHLGFADAANFSAYFRQHTGTAPAAFRTAQI
ncbi:AraC family transcriptional regulator [Streptomyces sp. NBC_00841]|uniref:helix-turn-helix domain-containing protein n=1 Tax=unclassified Streptomyces TaxID=2593676 RepID=UPI00224DF5AE|nr:MULTISPECIES: AraC family transcriptional regulator [unclassified Streptomyces]MCX4536532.1 AraC family transcriptional regulator [Streptomyces sp. NBC_01669]WRZ98237.1 AraC family transcriptional regulator [Streptomyces sp. NBC_00841]